MSTNRSSRNSRDDCPGSRNGATRIGSFGWLLILLKAYVKDGASRTNRVLAIPDYIFIAYATESPWFGDNVDYDASGAVLWSQRGICTDGNLIRHSGTVVDLELNSQSLFCTRTNLHSAFD